HVEAYTIASNSWRYVANYGATYELMAVAMGGYIYTAGGNGARVTLRYDPNTDLWDDAAIADLPVGRTASASDLFQGRWVLAGGDVGFANSANVIAWDPGTNTWLPLPDLVQPRDFLGGATVGGAFYTVGGGQGGWTSGTTD